MKRYKAVLKSFGIKEATIAPASGRSLTIPYQAVNIFDAIRRYSAPSIAEKLKGYYEDAGMELPNFDRLDKVERLQLLADAKATVSTTKAALKKAHENAIAARDAAAHSKASSNPIPNSSNTNNQ